MSNKSSISDKLDAVASAGAAISKSDAMREAAEAHGSYTVECYDKDGKLKWKDDIENVVTTLGKNLALDTFLAGAAYTVTGPFMGLINGSASSAVAADTMASHAAWLEVGGANAPAYTGGRKTVSWSAASGGSKSTSAAASFAITSTGTVGGCFIVLGAGALSTIANTGGVLYSAGAFTGGSKQVDNGDTLNVTYTASL